MEYLLYREQAPLCYMSVERTFNFVSNEACATYIFDILRIWRRRWNMKRTAMAWVLDRRYPTASSHHLPPLVALP